MAKEAPALVGKLSQSEDAHNHNLAHTAKVSCDQRTHFRHGQRERAKYTSLTHAWANFTLGNFFLAAWTWPLLRFQPELRLRLSLCTRKQLRSTIS